MNLNENSALNNNSDRMERDKYTKQELKQQQRSRGASVRHLLPRPHHHQEKRMFEQPQHLQKPQVTHSHPCPTFDGTWRSIALYLWIKAIMIRRGRT